MNPKWQRAFAPPRPPILKEAHPKPGNSDSGDEVGDSGSICSEEEVDAHVLNPKPSTLNPQTLNPRINTHLGISEPRIVKVTEQQNPCLDGGRGAVLQVCGLLLRSLL